MFYAKKIRRIGKDSKVLEVGPGRSPYYRSDVLLEKSFESDDEAAAQRGYTNGGVPNKPVVFFDGGRFPFKDKEFDYVICSHVLEHVDDIDFFCSELERVAYRGYIEFPTVYYEYLYNFSVHRNLMSYRDNYIFWIKKSDTPLEYFSKVNEFFYETLTAGNDQLIVPFREVFFIGFEWESKIFRKQVLNVSDLCQEKEYNEKSLKFWLARNFLIIYKLVNKLIDR